jgi:hypothetical protein
VEPGDWVGEVDGLGNGEGVGSGFSLGDGRVPVEEGKGDGVVGRSEVREGLTGVDVIS